jgi:hypothetical protein
MKPTFDRDISGRDMRSLSSRMIELTPPTPDRIATGNTSRARCDASHSVTFQARYFAGLFGISRQAERCLKIRRGL